jgi:DNA-binding winged helix-turn-helix (wHTH) protein
MFNQHTISKPSLLIVGDYLFDPQRCSLSGPTGAHHICPRMTALLTLLVQHANETVERDWLIRELWPEEEGSSTALSQYMSRLRHYLGDNAQTAQYIETVHHRGYRLLAPVFGSTSKPQDIPVAAAKPVSEANCNRFVNLIYEFRSRKVCRSLLIYTLVIWMVFQISEIVVPAVGLPNWANSLVVVLGILGFPIAAVLSWIFDITPSGVAREKQRDPAAIFEPTRNRMDLMFDSALVVSALTICGSLLASSLG